MTEDIVLLLERILDLATAKLSMSLPPTFPITVWAGKTLAVADEQSYLLGGVTVAAKKSIKNKKISSVAASKAAADTGGDREFRLMEEGARLYNARQFEQADDLIGQALAANPESPGLHSLKGQIALALERFAEAVGHFDVALDRFPDQSELRAHRARALLKLNRKQEGMADLEAIIAEIPNHYAALKYLGALWNEDGDNAKALDFLDRAAAINPIDPEILYLKGKAYFESDRLAEARNVLKHAIKLYPRASTPFNLMGATYRQECRFRIALSFCRHAFRLAPNDLVANINLGVALLETGHVHDSIAHLKGYLESNPDCDQAWFNMSTALLQIGRLEEGWAAYEARRRMHKLRDQSLPHPNWEGEPLGGKNIVVLAEQGIGDEIWAANMFDDLIRQADHCFIECDERLITLYARSFPTATILSRSAQAIYLPKNKPADYKSPGMSLARWLRSQPEQFPGKQAYLIPDPERRSFWRWRVAQLGRGLKVGISWRSMLTAGVRNDSYTMLEQWGDILHVAGTHFVNLQYGECQGELDAAQAATGVALHNFRDIDLKNDFDEIAALISELDIVIAPGNAVASLANALGVPVLQFVPSRYWACHGKDYDPWYPSAKLFFRPWDQLWTETLHALSVELTRRSRQHALESKAPSVDAEQERDLLRARIARAAMFVNSRKPENARDICAEILALRPDYSDALLLRGIAEAELGDNTEAERSFIRALEIDPLLPEAHNQLGALYLGSGQPMLATDAFRRALEIRPGYPDALNNLGNAHAAQRRFNEAIDCYQRAIATLSGFLTARYNLALTLDHLGKAEEALTEYETVVEGNPHHADAWNNLANLYARIGRREEALAAYRQATQANPELPHVRMNLATMLLVDDNHRAEAIGHLEYLAQLPAPEPAALNTLGVAYAMSERFEEAERQFRRAIDLLPDYADAYRNLGLALQNMGRLEEARENLLKALLVKSGGSVADIARDDANGHQNTEPVRH